MARMSIKGLDEFIEKLEAAGRRPESIVKMALFEGAGVVADAIRAGVSGIPTSENKRRPKQGVTADEKAGLLNGIGISHMRTEDETVNVVIGFNGTNAEGHKNTTIMRRLESGTSYQSKYPVVRPAVNRSRKAAQAAMQKVFTDELEKLV